MRTFLLTALLSLQALSVTAITCNDDPIPATEPSGAEMASGLHTLGADKVEEICSDNDLSDLGSGAMLYTFGLLQFQVSNSRDGAGTDGNCTTALDAIISECLVNANVWAGNATADGLFFEVMEDDTEVKENLEARKAKSSKTSTSTPKTTSSSSKTTPPAETTPPKTTPPAETTAPKTTPAETTAPKTTPTSTPQQTTTQQTSRTSTQQSSPTSTQQSSLTSTQGSSLTSTHQTSATTSERSSSAKSSSAGSSSSQISSLSSLTSLSSRSTTASSTTSRKSSSSSLISSNSASLTSSSGSLTVSKSLTSSSLRPMTTSSGSRVSSSRSLTTSSGSRTASSSTSSRMSSSSSACPTHSGSATGTQSGAGCAATSSSCSTRYAQALADDEAQYNAQLQADLAAAENSDNSTATRRSNSIGGMSVMARHKIQERSRIQKRTGTKQGSIGGKPFDSNPYLQPSDSQSYPYYGWVNPVVCNQYQWSTNLAQSQRDQASGAYGTEHVLEWSTVFKFFNALNSDVLKSIKTIWYNKSISTTITLSGTQTTVVPPIQHIIDAYPSDDAAFVKEFVILEEAINTLKNSAFIPKGATSTKVLGASKSTTLIKSDPAQQLVKLKSVMGIRRYMRDPTIANIFGTQKSRMGNAIGQVDTVLAATANSGWTFQNLQTQWNTYMDGVFDGAVSRITTQMQDLQTIRSNYDEGEYDELEGWTEEDFDDLNTFITDLTSQWNTELKSTWAKPSNW